MKDTEFDFDATETSATTASKKNPRIWQNIVESTDPAVKALLKQACALANKSQAKVITEPYGSGLDTMPSLKLSGSPEWQKTVLERNKFRQALEDFAEQNLKPGETIFVPVLVQLRKTNDTIEQSATDEITFDFVA